uniref:ATP-dependent RNA helicase n=1 Tax=Caenorhabditis japonica TaxID=281687 RepID=A0A8R1DRM8_CAEJA
MTAFEEYGVIPELSEALSILNWTLPTAVQSEAIPAILGGADALIAAETGSGKTGAFCLPIAQIVWEKRKDGGKSGGKTTDGSANDFVLNREDRDVSLQIDKTALNCESRVGKEWHGARGMAGVHTSGKYYYEVTITRDGLCRVGWATLKGSLKIGTDHESFGYGGTGKKSFGKSFDDYGKSFTTNDVLGCFLDLDSQKIWWSKNGEQFPVAYNLDKKFKNQATCLFPAVLCQNSSLSVNFGARPFNFPPGNKFLALCQAADGNVKWWSPAEKASVDSKTPLCVILEPTRELVQQTFQNMQTFATVLREPEIRCVTLAAGENMNQILRTLETGCDIVVGTPSRIVDLIQTGKLATKSLQFVVIDEVDQFLADRNGGARQIDNLFRALPLVAADGSRRQVIACSATLHNHDVERFADRHMSFPQWIDLKGTDCVSADVHHVVCHVDASEDKQWIRVKHEPNHLEDDHVHDGDHIRPGTNDQATLSLGTKILKGVYVVKAIQALQMDKAIIFCRTKQQCDHMEHFLHQNNLTAACLHGDRSAEERQKSLDDFKNDQMRFLICTDVVARGLDVQGVPFVINVTLPDDKAMYVHRIGRVGRAERMGLSISLVSDHDEKVWYHKCRNRGVNCTNTKEVEKGGCTIWFDEKKMLGEIEEHLGATIATVDSDFNVPVDEFDGKVVYGEKRGGTAKFDTHVLSLATSASQLADLETKMQLEYLRNNRHVFGLTV